MKHLFIINPMAGKGKALDLIPKIKKVFEKRNELYFIEVTLKPGHATEIVRRYVDTDKFRVYSVGGDGTLNEVLNGLVGSDSSLAVIPSGSGNDFIKSIIRDYNNSDILLRTINGNEELIDLAQANDKYFVNISSMGFDAEVVHNSNMFNRIPGISGKVSYILGIIFTVFKYKSKNVRINIDGQLIETKVLLVAVANGKFYGRGMMPAPEAKIDDGIFDICIISEISKIKILSFFPKIINGKHGELKEVAFYKGRRIEISSEKEIALNVDGEVSVKKEAIFEIKPKNLRIVIPK